MEVAGLRQFISEWNDSRDHVRVHTSGSTGRPKDIMLSKRDMAASATDTIRFFGLDAHSVLVCPLSMDYIAAKMMVVRSLLCGARLVMPGASNTFDNTTPAHLLAIVPSQVTHVCAGAVRHRNVIIGGAPLGDAYRRLLDDSGINAWQTYGMTETASHVALARPGQPYRSLNGSITFDTDARGCLVIDAPERDWRRIVTNDRVRLIDNHTFTLLGRVDNVINSGGIKLQIEQLEEEYARVLGIGAHAVLVRAVPDGRWGERPAAVIEDPECDTAALMALPALTRPARIERAPIPRTRNGKKQRSKT